ncbi:MAG: hypothetical protein HY805_03035 [Nitrospirae bacterium]|nr:hypothetical protein [Nitrospirota bacterium]
MKKYGFILFFLLIGLLDVRFSYGGELSGLQPLAPNGVFSIFSADTLKKTKVATAVSAEMAEDPDFFRYSFALAYGAGENVELSLNVPYIHEWQGRVDGMEDIAFGFKHRFFKEGKYGPSVAYLITASLIPGKEDFTTDGHIGAGIAISKRVGPVLGHANFIYAKPGDSKLQDDITFGAGFDFSAAHNFKFLAELYGKRSYYSSEIDKMELRAGARFFAGEYFFTTVGVGFDLKDTTPKYRLMLSLTMLYPEEKKAIKKAYEEEK